MTMYKSFKTDQKAEQEGIILDYGDFRVTVSRAGGSNKKYLQLLETRVRPFQRAIQAGTFDNERSQELLKDVYASTVIRDWEVKVGTEWQQGIENPDGGPPLVFSRENILLTFNNLPDLFADIMEQAGKAVLFRLALREEAAGN